MTDVFIAPFLLGLSVGIYCFAYCVPFIASFMVSEQRNQKQDFLVVLKFILGRLFGYLLFGAFIGYLGEKIDNNFVNSVLIFSLMLLSLILILHAFGLMRAGKFYLCAKIKKYNPHFPFLMGLLMGINVCPPFLMSLTYVFTLHSFFRGIIYFLMFFLGTSLYFLPISFLGFLNEKQEFQKAGRLSAIIVGVLFFFYGLFYFLRGANIIHLT